MTTELERAVDVIAAAPSLALACHVAPDGDALGSMLGLHHLARAAGRTSRKRVMADRSAWST